MKTVKTKTVLLPLIADFEKKYGIITDRQFISDYCGLIDEFCEKSEAKSLDVRIDENTKTIIFKIIVMIFDFKGKDDDPFHRLVKWCEKVSFELISETECGICFEFPTLGLPAGGEFFSEY